ncbi:uncharacterized protein EAF01_010798 [Botrytis porri]|uniref:uncharacterized protein n=1 Tax=Botrytis porri TaxID=87229 RepID=UPI001901F868|nr:uncharacterized protein EAF01_010798 [Botrytis porri]KAF7889305.1 hypothetical protein EAF01_010798 [Botrytis porri]
MFLVDGKYLGRSKTFETLNYVGPQDLRYIMLFPSNITSYYPKSSFQKKNAYIKSTKSPELTRIIQARYEPFVVLHTSGSTGTQKYSIPTHGTISQHETFLLPPPPGHPPITLSLYQNVRVFIGLGLFHSATLCFTSFCIYSTTTIVLPPPIPMTPEIANLAHLHGNLDASFLSPFILTQIPKTPKYLTKIKNLLYLNYNGEPLSTEIGNILKSHTRLFVHFGATETGFYAL